MPRLWLFEETIDTDVLAPGFYMKSPLAELAEHCLEAVRPEFASKVQKGDVVLAVIGEYPYSEGYGDDGDLSLNPADSEILKRVRASGNPLIVVMLSGRPLLVHDQIDGFDAFVASFLPGMAGEGIADVLFGDAQPQAKLNFTWPTSSEGIGVLFELGSGLTYK